MHDADPELQDTPSRTASTHPQNRPHVARYNPVVPPAFHFEHQLPFAPERAAQILRQIPALPGVFALHGPRVDGQIQAEPYLTRAADLRRRITRILAPPPQFTTDGIAIQSKRLNLGSRVATIAYTVTGSEFESNLTLYHAASSIFGLEQARKRLKLRTPYFLRFTAENAHPRVYSTNRLSRRALDNLYGPFPSRAAADRYCDAVLDLFKLRRCYEDLIPTPDHPGCVYQEMKKCLAPCNQAHTPQGAAAYSAEAAAVKRFFDTRGESMIIAIGLEREEASAAMEFEKAAALHAQWQKVKSAQSLADELIQPIPNLRAILVQKIARPPSSSPSETVSSSGSESLSSSAIEASSPTSPLLSPDSNPSPSSHSDPSPSSHSDLLLSSRSEAEGSASPAPTDESEPTAALFLLNAGCIAGPQPLSTLGVRAVKEQTSVGSSLFAQPLMLQAIPLDPSPPSRTTPSQSSDGDPLLAPSSTALPSSGSDSLPSPDGHSSPSPSTPPLLSSRSEAKGSAFLSDSAASLSPELRAEQVIASLEEKASAPADMGTLSDHLSLLRRWYYRPEKQRTGEIFFPRAEASFPSEATTLSSKTPNWPIRRILRGAARMALGEPKPIAETQRDQAQRNPEDQAQKPTRTKILHEGRPDVERQVPIVDKKFRSRKPLASPAAEPETPKSS